MVRPCTDPGFPYYVDMNVTLSLDDDLVRRVRKIAVDRDTTLTGLIRDHLQALAAADAVSGRKRREQQALERSFEQWTAYLETRGSVCPPLISSIRTSSSMPTIQVTNGNRGFARDLVRNALNAGISTSVQVLPSLQQPSCTRCLPQPRPKM